MTLANEFETMEYATKHKIQALMETLTTKLLHVKPS